MNKIYAKRIVLPKNDSKVLSEKKYSIANNNWDYESDVIADFDIAYNESSVYLKFFVQESNTKAVNKNFNEPVCEDSCVEFFISFDEKHYYNLEFNCIGNVLGGYGVGRNNREALDLELLKQINTRPSLGSNKIEIIDRKTEWTLDVVIPKAVFKYEKFDSLAGLKAKCNLYKCGDKQVFPHYLSWNPINVANPDFHLPEFFGDVVFE